MNTVSGTGQLLVAATPLGNLGDATRRLVDALATADLVAAEDTRKLRSLASGLGVTPAGKIVSFYDAVEQARLPGLVKAVASGQTVLLVTDAGMPSVSDPGYRLVAACVAEDLPITCLPGPSAPVTALALSGVPVDRFCFDGFPPRKPGSAASGWPRWPPRPGPASSSNHRIGWPRPWPTPSRCWAASVAARSAGS